LAGKNYAQHEFVSGCGSSVKPVDKLLDSNGFFRRSGIAG